MQALPHTDAFCRERACCRGVQVNVWDMSISTLDPIVSEKRENLATGEVCLLQNQKLSEEDGWWYGI